MAEAMVERLKQRARDTGLDCCDWSDGDLDALVRALLTAMREPTEETIEAFWETYPIDCGPIPIWQAMIDAALK